MTDKIGEMILEQLFKIQEKMATKEDLKNFATKDDLKEMENRIERKFDAKLDVKFEKQTKEIAEKLKNIYSLTERNRIKMAVEFDKKIGQLRKEFITANKQ